MSDPLSEQAIDDLREYVSREYVSRDYTSQIGADTRRETILALIAAHDRLSHEDVHPTSLRGQWNELRRRRAELEAAHDRLSRENAVLRSERDMYARADDAARAVRAHFNRRHEIADADGNLTIGQFSMVSDELALLVQEKADASAALDAWKDPRS